MVNFMYVYFSAIKIAKQDKKGRGLSSKLSLKILLTMGASSSWRLQLADALTHYCLNPYNIFVGDTIPFLQQRN